MSKKRIYLEKDVRPGVVISLKELSQPRPVVESMFRIEAEVSDGHGCESRSIVLFRNTAIELGRLLIKAFPEELNHLAKR